MGWVRYWAWKSLFPSGRRWTFFTAMAIMGITLGVAVLVIVQSVMNGFQAEIKKRLVETQGEIRVEAQGIDPEKFRQALSEFPEITAMAPYAQGMVMLMYEDVPAFAYAKGITSDESLVTGLNRMLSQKFSDQLNKDQIFIGANVAQNLGIQLGETVAVYSPISFEGLTQDEIIFPQELKVAGFFDAESYARDAVVCSLPCMQMLYELGENIHGMTLKLRAGIPVESFASMLQQKLGPEYRVVDWIHSNRDLLFTLRWEKTMMFFVLLFILLVASFSISSMLITNVVRKTREIGTVIAMGGQSLGVMGCFVLQSLWIGFLGISGGLACGAVILNYRDEILNVLYRLLNWENAQHYLSQFTHLPVAYETSDFVVICVFALLICIAAGLLPAWKAAHIHPAQALRYEQ